MYVIVYSVTLTVGDVEVNAEFYHGLSVPANDRFKLCLLGKRFAVKCLNKGSCARDKYGPLLHPRFKRQLRAINLKRLKKDYPAKGCNKAKLRQVTPVAAKEESPPGSQKPNLNNSCNSSIQKYDESVSASWGPQETSVWLQTNRYGSHIHTLSTYSGSDLLRLSKENLTQLCGLPDGIRLYNALHSRTIAPRLTVYLCLDIVSKVYQAVYLGVLTSGELQSKVASLLGVSAHHLSAIYLQGPNAIRVIVSDELVSHITDQSTFTVEILSHDAPTDRYQVLLKQTNAQAPT